MSDQVKGKSVREQLGKISDDWEQAEYFRHAGMHAAFRHMLGLEQLPSHKEDYYRARLNKRQPQNQNAGMNPGFFTPEQHAAG
jgi:hypothetical protein